MKSTQQIEKMFEEIGLGSEDERKRYRELAELGDVDVEAREIVVYALSDTSDETDLDDAELEFTS